MGLGVLSGTFDLLVLVRPPWVTDGVSGLHLFSRLWPRPCDTPNRKCMARGQIILENSSKRMPPCQLRVCFAFAQSLSA